MRRIVMLVMLAGLALGAVGCQKASLLPDGVLVANKDVTNGVTAATGAITVDGVLDEKAWTKACAMTDFVLGPSGKPEVQSRVLVTYDKDNLYVAVINEEPDTAQLKADAVERDGNVWSDDSVEIYIDSTNAKSGTSGYKGFFVNVKNTQYDRTEDEGWDPEWKSGVSVIEGKAWIVEVALPLKVLEITPEAGHELGLMVARNRRAGGRSESLYLVPCRDEAKDTGTYPVLELK